MKRLLPFFLLPIAAAGSPKVLAAGDSISVEFTAKFDAVKNSDSNFRVALFDSRGSQPAGIARVASIHRPGRTLISTPTADIRCS